MQSERFKEKLAIGLIGEEAVLPWLEKNNQIVLDNRLEKYKKGGPRTTGTLRSLAKPDFIIYNPYTTGVKFAVDIKTKTKPPYTVNNRLCFTVDKKFEEYLEITKIMGLDFLAIIFVWTGHMYFYKDSDVIDTCEYNNEHGTGTVYLFEYDKLKVVR